MATDSFSGIRVESRTNNNVWACVGLRIVKGSRERFSTSIDVHLEVLTEPSRKEVVQYDEVIDDCNGGIARVYSYLLRCGRKIDFCVEVTSVTGVVGGSDEGLLNFDSFGFSASAVLGTVHLLREMKVLDDEREVQGVIVQQTENWRAVQ